MIKPLLLLLFLVLSQIGAFSRAWAAEWTGSLDTAWGEPENWVGNIPPTSADIVIIPVVSTANYPVLDSFTFVDSLSVQAGASMTIANGGSFQTSNVQIAGLLTLSPGGTLEIFNDSGLITIDAGGILELNGGNLIPNVIGIENSGRIEWTQGDFILQNGAALNNRFEGIIRISGSDPLMKLIDDGSFCNFINEGQVIKDSTGEVIIAPSEIDHTGTVNINSGTLIFGLDIGTSMFATYSGNFQIAQDAAVRLYEGSHFFSSSMSGTAPTVEGTGEFIIGSSTRFGTIDIDPYVFLEADLLVNAPLILNLTTLEGPGNLAANGNFIWRGGDLIGDVEAEGNADPSVMVNSTGLIVSDLFKKLYFRNMLINGEVNFSNGEFHLGGGSEFRVSSGGSLRLVDVIPPGPAPEMKVLAYDTEPGNQFVNEGAIRGIGTISLLSNSNPSPPYFENNGVIAPGPANLAGSLTINTDTSPYTYDHSSADLVVDILGATPGAQYDQFIINGSTSLGGSLSVNLYTTAYTPQAGDTFDIVQANSIGPTAAFDVLNLRVDGVSQSFSEYFSIEYFTTGVRLEYSKPPPVFNTLAISVLPAGGGTVTLTGNDGGTGSETGSVFTCLNACSTSFESGTVVNLAAQPASGYEFVRWEGQDSVDGDIAVVVLESDRNVAAVFSPVQTPIEDFCPSDPDKTFPGICGCGVPDIDSDGDGTPDCIDECPDNPEKILTGDCGCDTPDVDTDGDSVPDCLDQCPEDPDKIFPGLCGCGVSEIDSDADTVLDCLDECPEDPLKIIPGECGCGVPEIDTDGDSVLDCLDTCPEDPLKLLPGDCGCGIPETDRDGDGVPDCIDQCPDDPQKAVPGICGCGVLEIDSDLDTILDCLDACPEDPLKIIPGECGCGIPDVDTDGDGILDCLDNCPDDPLKALPGDCGCGFIDEDRDGDGIPDCLDPENPDRPFAAGTPIAVFPEAETFLTEEAIGFEGIIVSNAGVGVPVETHFQVRPRDLPFDTVEIATTYGGIARATKELETGLAYGWRIGYRHPDTGRMVWSEENRFTIGLTETAEGPDIPPGAGIEQYRMASFPFWPEDPDAFAVLGDDIGGYDTRFFKIGAYDAETGEYIEFDHENGMEFLPGRAYWFLAREGLTPTVTGIRVTRNTDIHVPLFINRNTGSGWNMIAPPNTADYLWRDVQVIAYNDQNQIEFGPVPVSALTPDNLYLDLELWRWNAGEYVSFRPEDPEAVLYRNRGYWVGAREERVYLIFSPSAQKNIEENGMEEAQEGAMFQTLRTGGEWIGKALNPASATADTGGDTPPMPMGGLSGSSNNPSTRVDGGGGCFIDLAAE